MVWVTERDHSRDPTRVERADQAGAHLDGHPASLANCRKARDRNDAIAVGVNDFLDLHRNVFEVLGPYARELQVPLASDYVLKTCRSTRYPLMVGGEEALPDALVVRSSGITHTFLSDFEHSADDLHVLLRHRLPSIPQLKGFN
jgi:hypothetical protein